MSYLVSVDVCPDTREQEQREYENELIENGQAVRCTECGELLTADDRGYEAEYCEKCVRRDVKELTDAVTLKDSMYTTGNLAIIKGFLWRYEDELINYLMDEEVNDEL